MELGPVTSRFKSAGLVVATRVDWWRELPNMAVVNDVSPLPSPRSPSPSRADRKGRRDSRNNNKAVEPTMPPVVWETEEEAAVPLSEGAGAAWDNDHASVRSLSTYPLLPTGQRDGDPNADCAWVRLYPTRAILALADGCNWGYRPREAARSAVAALKDYLSRRVIGYLPDLHEAAHYLLRGFAEADRKIMEGKDDTWEAGTTTLIGGVLLQLVPASSSSSSTSSPSTSPPAGGEDMGGGEWGFVCCSVGDCKAFRYAAANGGEVTDITAGNRLNVTDVRDPGGRLGPYLEGGAPDLRNLKLYYISCEPGDLLLFLSDGVHDNFDPQMLGKVPREAGLDHVSDESWDVADNEVMLEIEIAKDQYRRQVLKQLIEAGPINPKAVTERLMAHCYSTTRACREYMETNPQARQPTDYRQFPGKMDHTTAACLVIPSRGSFARS